MANNVMLDQPGLAKLDIPLYQDSNALVTCFEHVDVKWYHLLITPLEFECQTSSAACFDQ